MRTRTIFRAYVFAGEEYRSGMRTGRRRRRMRQIGVFADELERRMDERDSMIEVALFIEAQEAK